MIVNAATFEKLLAGSVTASVLGEPMRLPSLNHLLALKLHALKGNASLRVMKDMDDVIQLLAINRVDATGAGFRVALKSGDEALYENCGPPLKTDLDPDLPDWSGAKPLRQPAGAEALERLRKAHHSRRHRGREHQLARLRRKQDVEFII